MAGIADAHLCAHPSCRAAIEARSDSAQAARQRSYSTVRIGFTTARADCACAAGHGTDGGTFDIQPFDGTRWSHGLHSRIKISNPNSNISRQP